MGMVPPPLSALWGKREKVQPKEEHPSTMHPEMQPTGEVLPPQGGDATVPVAIPIRRVPWSDLPVSPLTGLPYDPELIQEWPQGGHSNTALLRLMKGIEECISAKKDVLGFDFEHEYSILGEQIWKLYANYVARERGIVAFSGRDECGKTFAEKRQYVAHMLEAGLKESEFYTKPVEELAREVGLL